MLAQRRRLPRDWFFAPTLLTDVRNSMSVAREEVFGPVFTEAPWWRVYGCFPGGQGVAGSCKDSGA
jgi:hypothetical protein